MTISGLNRRYSIAILVLLASVCFCAFVVYRPTEPKYHGKTLRYWLRGYQVSDEGWNGSTPHKADQAVVHLGTNAIPTLLKMLRSRDSAFDLKLQAWGYKWKQFAKKHNLKKDVSVPRLPSCEVLEAQQAFETLGPGARCAVPGLIKLLEDDLPPISKRAITAVLGQIGPGAKSAVVVLSRIATDPDVFVRQSALQSLGNIACKPELSVPAMIRGLNDESVFVVQAAASGLRAFGPEAKAAAPTLTNVLTKWEATTARFYAEAQKSPDSSIPVFDDPTDALKEALKAIGSDSAAKANMK